MKALVYLGPGRMEIQDAPDPTPGPGEILMRVGLSAICGSDLHGFRHANPRRVPPLVMGHEAVGVIDAVGRGVDPGRTGERVILKPILACGTCERCRRGQINLCKESKLVGRDVPGAFAELVALPDGAAVPFESATAEEIAVLTEPFANCIRVVDHAVREGDSVLVIGAGPIGLLTVRAARLAGAGTIVAADRLVRRLDLAKEQGADVVLDVSDADADDDPADAVRDVTGGVGASVVIDAVGIPDTVGLALRAVAVEGRIELVGLGAPEGPVRYHALMDKQVTLSGGYAWSEGDFSRSLAFLQAGAVDVASWLTRMPLEDGQRAFEELAGPAASLVKVVLEP